mgnify:FL=1|tara:strand:+ start:328 stop:891 length:564 start_codon:yes stop_codon:yes gene_type:complete
MQSPFYFIVTPVNNKRYNNTKKVGKVELITSTSQEDHKASNRFCTVVEVPLGYKGEIVKGDTLVVHHNVFKYYYDMKGRERSGRSFFKENLFFVDFDQFFLYKHKGEWRSHSKYCFIKPIPLEDSIILKGGNEEPLLGTIRYGNVELEKLGVKVNDRVSFTPESEYEFYIDDEKLYRMFTNNITIKL